MANPSKMLNPGDNAAAYFGWELRKHRESRGWSQDRLAEELICSKQQVQHLESARRQPSTDLADALNRIFRTERFGHLLELIKKEQLPSWFYAYVKKEAEASSLKHFEPLLMPGVLQTEEYARAILAVGQEPAALEQALTTRMERQRILDRPDPPRFWIILDAGVIHRCIGSPATMKGQLRYLLDCMDRYNISIQVVSSSVGAYPGLQGALTVMSFATGPDMAYVEAPGAGLLLEQPDTVSEISVRFDLIRAAAMSENESLRLLKEAL